MPRPRFHPFLPLCIALFISCFVYFLYTFESSVIPTPPKLEEKRPGPIYKNLTLEKVRPPIQDNFPLANTIFSKRDFPSIASWNKPPTIVRVKTPLFIGFSRNWPMLQQVVVSYITSGWPPEQIYVVENTGTMYSNKRGLLSLQNPNFLNHTRLESFGVNVIITPTLLTFAQLQNFFIFQSLERGWEYYFWGHMDILALTEERWPLKDGEFSGFYARAVDKFREVTSLDYLRNKETDEKQEWAIQFFAYDWLALNNVKSFLKVGAWDPFISYYKADCDMHSRLHMANLAMPIADTGRISDITGSLDLNLLFRRKIDPDHPPRTAAELNALPEDERGGAGFQNLTDKIQILVDEKAHGAEERNSWQYKQVGGHGDPFYRRPQGFETALQMAIANGVKTYDEKWGRQSCDLLGGNLKAEDAWMVEHDWE